MSVTLQVKGKGSWTPGEDATLRANHAIFGNKWTRIAQALPGRTGKQCRERWTNHLDHRLKKSEWTDDEEALLIGLHKQHGNKVNLDVSFCNASCTSSFHYLVCSLHLESGH